MMDVGDDVERDPLLPDEIRERLAEGIWKRFSFMRTHGEWEDMSPGHKAGFYRAVDSLGIGEILEETKRSAKEEK